MPLKTRVTEMLGIEHPLVMGGLTGVGTVELAAAVSNAGGLGMFTAHNAGSPEGARRRCDDEALHSEREEGEIIEVMRPTLDE